MFQTRYCTRVWVDIPSPSAVILTIEETDVVKVVPSLQSGSKCDCTKSGANASNLTVRWDAIRLEWLAIMISCLGGHGRWFRGRRLDLGYFQDCKDSTHWTPYLWIYMQILDLRYYYYYCQISNVASLLRISHVRRLRNAPKIHWCYPGMVPIHLCKSINVQARCFVKIFPWSYAKERYENLK